MHFRAQITELRRQQPAWLRLATLLCIFLIGSVSTAQAAHIHGEWLPHTTPEITKHTTGPATTSEDACPLCVAMHSALPTHAVKAPVAGLLDCAQAPAPALRHVAAVWHFELFSRPPPSLL